MVELVVRLVLALVPAALGWQTGRLDLQSAMTLAGVLAAYAPLVAILERRDMRAPRVAGAIGALDAVWVAAALGALGMLDRWAFCLAVPAVWAAARWRAMGLALAPVLGASATVSAWAWGLDLASLSFWAQVVLAMAVAATPISRPEQQTVYVERDVDAPEPKVADTDYIELRENYRKLRDFAKRLESRSKRDIVSAQLYEAAFANVGRLHHRLAYKLREITGVDGVTLYSVAQVGDAMVVRASSGQVPEGVERRTFPLNKSFSEAQLLDRAAAMMRALKTEADGEEGVSVLLKDQGRLVGLACLFEPEAERLKRARETTELAAPALGQLLRKHDADDRRDERLKIAELLYLVSTTGAGAETSASLMARVVRELWATLEIDHLAMWVLDGNAAQRVAGEGAGVRFLETMSFAEGPGVEGWLGIDAPELMLFDAGDDLRSSREAALRNRVGSFCLVPIRFGERPFGYLTAATHRVGGLDKDTQNTLRSVGAELSQAVARIEIESPGASGLATPKEFQKRVAEAGEGCMVVLEPLRKDELVEAYGHPAVELALRTLAHRLRPTLPAGGILCRRAEGDFLVFLRETEIEFARRWANEAAATASTVPVATPDGSRRMPLAVRAKASAYPPTNAPKTVSAPKERDLIPENAG